MDKSEVIIKPYHSLPCELEMFYIKGEQADEDVFGESRDFAPELAEPYGCGCYRFKADLAKAPQAMTNYGLTLEDFVEVCDMLEDALDVGECGWCT